MVHDLRGMFAFALWDSDKKRETVGLPGIGGPSGSVMARSGLRILALVTDGGSGSRETLANLLGERGFPGRS
jgi:hypothetical protein